MELRIYTAMILGRWRLIVGAFGITFILTAILVMRQPWSYEATSTYVIRPSREFAEAPDDFVRAIDTLSRHTDINTTFSQVAGSKVIKQRAIERLGLSDQDRKGLQVSGAAVAGSNIMEISVRGPQPGIVRDVANAVGAEAAEYMRGLYGVFELELLDEAGFPADPAGPNKPLTLAVGAMFGVMLGVALVFVAEYLQQPLPEANRFDIIDGDSGLYNKAYFLLRLGQEMSRAENSDHIFSLALIRIRSRRLATGVTRPISAAIAATPLLAALEGEMRKEDVLARVDEDLFALLLPATSNEAAKGLLDRLPEKVHPVLMNESETVRRTIGNGATTDVIGVAVTHSDTSIQQSEEALFAHAASELAQKESESRRAKTSSTEKVTDLLFLPGMEKARDGSRDKDSARDAPAKTSKKAGG